MTHQLRRHLVPFLLLALVAGLGFGIPADAQDQLTDASYRWDGWYLRPPGE